MRGNRTFKDFNPTVDWNRSAEVDAVKISLPGKQRNRGLSSPFLKFLKKCIGFASHR
jgi:hypothetical protein